MSRFLRVRRRGRPPHPDVLTPAEWGVLDGVRDGLTNAEVAERLGVSVNTVRYHVSNMLSKLGVPDRQALAAWRGQPAPEPSESHRRWGGLLGLARLLGVAAALLVVAVLAWVALDRLSGSTRELPAAAPEATRAVGEEMTATVESVRGADVPFASEGREWGRAMLVGSFGGAAPKVAVAENGDLIVATTGPGGPADSPMGYDWRPNPTGTPLDFQGGTHDIVLARFTADGTPLWSRIFGGPGQDYVSTVALTSDGDILLSGTYSDGFDVGEGPIRSAGVDSTIRLGERDAFVARLDPQGRLEWVEAFGTDYDDNGGSVVGLRNGDVIVVALTDAPAIQIGDIALDLGDTPQSVAVRLTEQGEVVWAQPLDTRYATELTVDPSTGDLVIALSEGVEGRGAFSLTGLLRLSPEGEELARVPIPGSPTGEFVPLSAADLEIDEDGTVLIAGTFEGQVDLGGGLLTAQDFGSEVVEYRQDGFVARFARDGTHLMSRVLDKPQDGVGALAIDTNGDILIAGRTYIERLDHDGNVKATMPFPDERVDEPMSLEDPTYVPRRNGAETVFVLLAGTAATEDGEVIVGGRFWDRLAFDFGGRILSKRGIDDFIARVEAP